MRAAVLGGLVLGGVLGAGTVVGAGSNQAFAEATARPAHQQAGVNLQVLPASTPPAQLEARMQGFDRGLGVSCNFCHAGTDYASDAVDMKNVARRMMRMTDAMNLAYFDGRAEISCYTCHSGKRQPLRQPPAGGGR